MTIYMHTVSRSLIGSFFMYVFGIYRYIYIYGIYYDYYRNNNTLNKNYII